MMCAMEADRRTGAARNRRDGFHAKQRVSADFYWHLTRKRMRRLAELSSGY
jgi:hypothetical protein